MLLKSLLTGVVLAGLAGGVVYFGTGTSIAGADVKSAVSDIKVETSKMTENVSANVKEKIEDIRTETGLVEADRNNTAAQPRVYTPPSESGEIKRPLQQDDKIQFDIVETENEAVNLQTPASEAPVLEAKINDKALAQAPIVEAPKQQVVNTPPTKNWLSRFLDNQKAKREAARDARAEKLGIERQPARTIADTPQKEARAKLFSRKADSGKNDSSVSVSQDVQEVYDTVLDQTDTIEIVELKDRAYLSLIDYTIRNRAFDKSKAVVQMISQPELRDTARSNIAVGYARLGERDNAFDVLQDVEIDALSDVLRLQVIEAMTAPNDY